MMILPRGVQTVQGDFEKQSERVFRTGFCPFHETRENFSVHMRMFRTSVQKPENLFRKRSCVPVLRNQKDSSVSRESTFFLLSSSTVAASSLLQEPPRAPVSLLSPPILQASIFFLMCHHQFSSLSRSSSSSPSYKTQSSPISILQASLPKPRSSVVFSNLLSPSLLLRFTTNHLLCSNRPTLIPPSLLKLDCFSTIAFISSAPPASSRHLLQSGINSSSSISEQDLSSVCLSSRYRRKPQSLTGIRSHRRFNPRPGSRPDEDPDADPMTRVFFSLPIKR